MPWLPSSCRPRGRGNGHPRFNWRWHRRSRLLFLIPAQVHVVTQWVESGLAVENGEEQHW